MLANFDGKSYYEILGVTRDASTDEIKEAYREIARVYHPDSNFYKEILEYAPDIDQVHIFKVITTAYNTLTNPQKREAYDKTLPPELRGWEANFRDQAAEELEAEHSREREKKERQRRSSATWNRFGVVEAQDDRAEEIVIVKPEPHVVGTSKNLRAVNKARSGQFSGINAGQKSVDDSSHKSALQQSLDAKPALQQSTLLVRFVIFLSLGLILGMSLFSFLKQ